MKKCLAVVLVCTVALLCQTQVPSIGDYMNSTNGLVNNSKGIIAAISATDQSKIDFGGQHMPANENWFDVGILACDPLATYGSPTACFFNNVVPLNGYSDTMKNQLGMTHVDANIDVLPFVCSAEYVTYGGTIPCNNPTWGNGSLANLDSWFNHVRALGMKPRIAPTPTQTIIGACGLNSSSGLTQMENCWRPFYKAVAGHWPLLDSFTLVHEIVGSWGISPFGPFPAGMTMSTADWITFITDMSTAVHSVTAGIKTGAAAETMFAGDATNWAAFIANAATMGLNFLAVDLYPISWNIQVYRSTTLATGGTWAAQARALFATTTLTEVRLNEINRPPWVPQNASPQDPNAFVPAGACTWVQNQADIIFFASMVNWASSHGYSSISPFATPPFIYCSQVVSNSYIQSGTYVYDTMSHLNQATATGAYYKKLAGWRQSALHGQATLHGQAKLK